ncbi:MAG: hypothetical protein KDJ38_11620 [Gammaproteobacteria bacterium]|nr:hypothetical protein [Gammaproteobacteria bacterium]
MQAEVTQQKPTMQVPNWLIALELALGAALLYVSSSALVLTDMHVSTRVKTHTETTTSTQTDKQTILVSATAGIEKTSAVH